MASSSHLGRAPAPFGPPVLGQAPGGGGDGAHDSWRMGRPSGPGGPPVLALTAAASSAGETAAVTVDLETSDLESEDDGTFDGASGASRMKPNLWICQGCGASFPLVSWMANVRTCDKTFFGFQDKRLRDIFEREAGFKNLYEAGSVMLACPYCCEAWHDQVYVDRKDPDRHRLLEKYRRRAMNSRGMKMQDSRVAWICKHADRHNSDASGVSHTELFQLMSANQQFRKSTDFIYILSPWCALFYGCEYCLVVPLRSCSWWRTVRPLSAPAEGLTESSGGGGNKPKAHWRCGNCLEEWTWRKQGATRVFAIGGNGGEGDTFSDYIYAYIGWIPQALENRINFIKGCVLLKQINGRVIGKEVLIKAITELNAVLETRFKNLEEVGVFTAKDPLTHDYFKVRGAQILCEDPRLSLATPGQSYKGIDLRRVKSPPAVLTPDEVEFLVDTIAGTLDVEAVVTKPGSGNRKIQWDILGSEHFKRSRTTLDRLTCESPQDAPGGR